MYGHGRTVLIYKITRCPKKVKEPLAIKRLMCVVAYYLKNIFQLFIKNL